MSAEDVALCYNQPRRAYLFELVENHSLEDTESDAQFQSQARLGNKLPGKHLIIYKTKTGFPVIRARLRTK
jgi:hypothetical protein